MPASSKRNTSVPTWMRMPVYGGHLCAVTSASSSELSLDDVRLAFESIWAALPGAPSLSRASTAPFDSDLICATLTLLGPANVVTHVHIAPSVAEAVAVSDGSVGGHCYVAAADVAGELANQLAGAVKVFFGAATILSVPVVERVDAGLADPMSRPVSWSSDLGSVAVSVDCKT